MTPTPRHVNPWVLFVPSLLIFLAVVLGILWSSSVLLSVGLLAGLVLVIAYLFVTAGHQHALEEAVAAAQTQVAMLTDKVEVLHNQLAAYTACDAPLFDNAVVEIARPRSARCAS